MREIEIKLRANNLGEIEQRLRERGCVLSETNKCEQWKWFDINNPPKEIFASSQWAIDAQKENFIFKDAV